MILALDTTELTRDPWFSGAAWRILANARDTWKIRIVLTEVVVLEATGNFERRVLDASEGLKKWTNRYRPIFGGNSIYKDASDPLGQLVTDHQQRFNSIISALNIEVISPAIPHSELIQRAVSRRRPCNENGDGYRDTLNWLSLLDLINATDRSEEIVWVSNNFKDFGTADDPQILHEHLTEDLQIIEAAGRVTWFHDLSKAVLYLAEEKSELAGADLKQVERYLRQQALSEAILALLSSDFGQFGIDPADCGLPIQVYGNPRLTFLHGISKLDWKVKGSAGPDTSLIEVDFVADVDIEAMVYSIFAFEPEVQYEFVDAISDSSAVIRIRKSLLFEALLTATDLGKIEEVEIIEIHALPGDPGVRTWKETSEKFRQVRQAHRLAHGSSNINFSAPIPPDFAKNFQSSLLSQSALSNLKGSMIGAEALRGLQSQISAHGLADISGSRSAIDALTQATRNLPDMSVLRDPKVLEQLRLLGESVRLLRPDITTLSDSSDTEERGPNDATDETPS
ncbi:PIN domain-containing protein [Kineosporia sp. NBRC 101731]|uniref:PIN domain-containing protein n=1 Tax=Kineosporia sp. NBRC 101731 TaxID=3032199 RepID=UPI0024A3CD20|nr:PIN domain-containing protein [Kineosporia sp. NBRC 101731]GLY32429.1 hypothetical protein Kisp02_57940 [Kineosporia sp. NBRC 101731]